MLLPVNKDSAAIELIYLAYAII